jgi:IclR family transcriptional regulator, pca regulon regulatory protein
VGVKIPTAWCIATQRGRSPPGARSSPTARGDTGHQAPSHRPPDRRAGRGTRWAAGSVPAAPPESEGRAPVPRTAAQRVPVPGEEWVPAVPTLREPRFSQSLERGLAILGCFTPERPVLGIVDMADELGMSRGTTHRYAMTLTELGFLVRAPKRRYRLALRVTELGMSAMGRMRLRDHAGPYLEELRARTGYAVGVGVLDGPRVLIVAWLPGTRRPRRQADPGFKPGDRLPVHCTAVGKLLLAHLPEAERKHALAAVTLSRLGPNTITGKRGLLVELDGIRGQSLAGADEESAPGVCSIAAPVRGADGETAAALGLDAHSSMISLAELVDKLGPHVISAADRISARLGYRRAEERREGHVAPGADTVVA